MRHFIIIAMLPILLFLVGCEQKKSRVAVSSTLEDQIASEKWKGAQAFVKGDYATNTLHSRRALALDPTNIPLKYDLAMSLRRTKQYSESDKLLQEVAKNLNNSDAKIRSCARSAKRVLAEKKVSK